MAVPAKQGASRREPQGYVQYAYQSVTSQENRGVVTAVGLFVVSAFFLNEILILSLFLLLFNAGGCKIKYNLYGKSVATFEDLENHGCEYNVDFE
jgi:hypothetical protein